MPHSHSDAPGMGARPCLPHVRGGTSTPPFREVLRRSLSVYKIRERSHSFVLKNSAQF